MLCEKCKKNTATVCVTTIINGDKTVKNLCPNCAEQEGHLNITMPFDHNFSLQNLWPTIFSLGQEDLARETGDVCCPQCHLSFQEFAKGGRFGCSRCYEEFQSQLKGILHRVQGSEQHTGKLPKRLAGVKGIERQVDALKEQLQQAVAVENFELAATLRDEIKSLQETAAKGDA